MRPRLIALYLPQYHPIPENDLWWGKGFTEWTNVAKAMPLYKGHYQPHLPADLGYYDLRVPEVRAAQAELARTAGIEGFCYWHYWFGGKRLLERPTNEVLETGKPDFPFCLGWANQSWTGIWHGNPDKILIQQTYPGDEDFKAHFLEVLKFFKDKRYLQIEGKPLFLVFQPKELPDSRHFITLWRKLAVENGLNGIYFLGLGPQKWDFRMDGFDGAIVNSFDAIRTILHRKSKGRLASLVSRITRVDVTRLIRKLKRQPLVYRYQDFVNTGLPALGQDEDRYPMATPNWDNTPRSNANGFVFHGPTPELFKKQLQEAIAQVNNRSPEKRLVFIKSWNEWAEGNYLEPDQKFGSAYLQAVRETLQNPE